MLDAFSDLYYAQNYAGMAGPYSTLMEITTFNRVKQYV